MEDKKLLKIAENCCSDMVNCERCPLDADALTADECMAKVIRFLLEIVSRQKAEIKKKDTEIAILIRKNEALKDEVSELRAEIERLKGPNRAYPFCNLIGGCLVFSKNLKDYNDMRKGIESEARKEFAERLKNSFCISKEYLDVMMIINNLLAEMEERK